MYVRHYTAHLSKIFHLSSFILFIEIELEGKCMLWGYGGGGAKLDLMPSSNAGGVN